MNIIDRSENIGMLLRGKRFPRWVVDIILMPSDLAKIRKTYCEAFGVNPRLFRPQNFNEWLQHSKIFHRKKRHIIMADKIQSRDWIEQKIGSSMLSKIYWSGSNLNDVDKNKLPKKFVIKSNQGSGTNIFVTDEKNVDWRALAEVCHKWLINDHSVYFAEWQYRWIEPKILIEEYLTNDSGDEPVEYQFFCIKGKCIFIEVDFDRRRNHRRLFLDRNFVPINMQIRLPAYEGKYEIPEFADEMLKAAEVLAENELFLRVDFYDIGKPKIGELTFHPGAGLVKFSPSSWNEDLGKLFQAGNPKLNSNYER